MNVFINSVLLLLILNILFIFNIPNLTNDNFIYHKLLIFSIISLSQLLLFVISKSTSKCFNFKNIFEQSISDGLNGIIGYSLYLDLLYMASTSTFLLDYTSNTLYKNLTISLFIISFIAKIKILRLIFGYNDNDCSL